MIVLLNATIDIAIFAIILSIVSKYIQNKYVNHEELKQKQERIKEKQKKMQELIKKDDKESKNKLAELEKEVMQDAQEIMQSSMKSMMFTMLLIIPFFMFFSWNYADVSIQLPIAIPFFAKFEFLNPFSWINFKLYHYTNWIGWYILVSLICNIAISIILKIYKGLVHKK